MFVRIWDMSLTSSKCTVEISLSLASAPRHQFHERTCCHEPGMAAILRWAMLMLDWDMEARLGIGLNA